MRPVLHPSEMAEADRRTIAAGTPQAVLMERAGSAVAFAVRRVAGGTYGRRVVVLCGSGNNGGDGLVAARHLRAWGARVETFELRRGEAPPGGWEAACRRADVVVDALFGTGFRGRLEGEPEAMSRGVRDLGRPVVAVDIPSGVAGDTGEVDGEAFGADVTVTFAACKPGVLFEPGRSHAGSVEVVDIGIPVRVDHAPDTGGAPVARGDGAGARSLAGGAGDGSGPGGAPAPADAGAGSGSRRPPGPVTVTRCGVTEAADVAGWLPPRPPAAHKWSAGVFVVGGSGGMVGAPMLASRAALRAGAGIVHCGLPGHEAAARASGGEVISRALPARGEALDAAATGIIVGSLGRFGSLVLGPGLGTAESTRMAVDRTVVETEVPLVLDADGLNGLEGDLGPIRERRGPTVLTPHDEEYRRLAGRAVGPERIGAARELASRAGAVVLLKGPATVVAAPDGRVAVNPTGGSVLASAGTGDVLSGILGAFLARGVPAFEAAAAAAFVHGRAGHEIGEGLVAGDLISRLPRTISHLEVATPET